MIRIATVALLLLVPAPLPAQTPAGPFQVADGEVFLLRLDGGAVLGALPGAAGRLLPGGLELTAGTAVVAWSGTVTVNGAALSCDVPRCQRIVGDDTPDAVTNLQRLLLERRDLPLDLATLRDELKKEEAAFTETGVVSVEAGSVCLDSAGADGGGASGIENPQTQVEKTPATVRVKITFE